MVSTTEQRRLNGEYVSVPKSGGERAPFKEKALTFILRAVRILVIADIVLMFFPAFNPARVSGAINKNLSLFTCGTNYSALVQGFGRAFARGWVNESTFKLLFAGSMVSIAAAVIYAAGACASLGNVRMKKLSVSAIILGTAASIVSLIMIYSSYIQMSEADNVEKILPVFPKAFYIYAVVTAIIFILSAAAFFIMPKYDRSVPFEMEDKFMLFLLFLPIILLTFLFSYLPLLGWRYAFFDYKAGDTLSMDKFVGFKWFTQLFQNSATKKDILRVIKNTLAMSGLGIATSWLPMMFAIFLTEIKNNRFRRIVQTFTTIPNFISWVLVYAIALALFSTDGFINTFINSTGGMSDTNYLMSESHMWLKMLAWGTWKSLGWNAIIYVASISGIDQSLYEAASIDGAGRFQKMWYVTVPSLIPTYMVLLLMSVANILTNGMDQYLVFSNAVNKDAIEVLDLYVYNRGITGGLIPLSTVIGMVKSVISVILLFSANGISKAVRGESIV